MTTPDSAAVKQDDAELPRAPLSVGDVFHGYRIRGEIARGGSAVVFDAYHDFMDRAVALKAIPCKAAQAREFKRRARAEAMVLSRLRHPNLVRAYDAGVSEDGSFIYIVMERLEGCTLREALTALGALSVPEALMIGAQTSDAVEAAHRLGAIHRDLKPENIFIERDNHVRVLDFGVAKYLGAGFETTAKYRWHGTPLYMSPEHLQGKGVTPRSDVYALGTLLWEALAGRNPCLNGIQAPTFEEIGWIQIAGVPDPLNEVVPQLPEYVARVIERAIAKDPDKRYTSMHEFGLALRDAEHRFRLECQEQRIAVIARSLPERTGRARAQLAANDPAGAQSPISQPLRTVESDATSWPAGAGPAPIVEPETQRMARAPIPPAAGAVAAPAAAAPAATALAAAAPPAARIPGRQSAAVPAALASPRAARLEAPAAERPRAGVKRESGSFLDRLGTMPSSHLTLLAIAIGLVIALPIGIGVGLAARHARRAAARARASASASAARRLASRSAAARTTAPPTPAALAPAPGAHASPSSSDGVQAAPPMHAAPAVSAGAAGSGPATASATRPAPKPGPRVSASPQSRLRSRPRQQAQRTEHAQHTQQQPQPPQRHTAYAPLFMGGFPPDQLVPAEGPDRHASSAASAPASAPTKNVSGPAPADTLPGAGS